MARLPSMRFIMQEVDGMVVLFEEGTEEEIVKFDPTNANASALAQKDIYDSDKLSDEDKCFAHFWSGYFYGRMTG